MNLYTQDKKLRTPQIVFRWPSYTPSHHLTLSFRNPPNHIPHPFTHRLRKHPILQPVPCHRHHRQTGVPWVQCPVQALGLCRGTHPVLGPLHNVTRNALQRPCRVLYQVFGGRTPVTIHVIPRFVEGQGASVVGGFGEGVRDGLCGWGG